jgi:spore germination protein KA
VCYLENIVNRKLLRELYRRLDTIDIDGILDSNYISEHIAERSVLGFITCGYTERPDIVVAKLLEGRIAVVVDGTPQVLTLPYLFIENFQSNEDYYLDYLYASFSRMLRIISFLLTVTVPAIYVAIESFHHEILPTALMIGITNERQSVPLTAALEAIVMLLVFDFLREAGIRMPSSVGQALSVVGGLVIGQAAVEAKLVASPMIIVVAFTGITCLLIPKMTVSSLIGRYGCLLLAAGFGIVGVAVGLSILAIHILNLQSFGVPSLLPVDQLQYQDVKDLFTRAPWPKMLTRIAPLSDNRIRSRPKPIDGEGGELR